MTEPALDPPTAVVGVVLAAGAGTRLRPLTDLRPKALCPVANRPLVDWALARVAPHTSRVAVNVHHHREQLAAHLAGPVAGGLHLSVEEPVALGTAGALGQLRDWVSGHAVLLSNADAWSPDSPESPDPLARLLAGWDGERPRLLCRRDPLRGDFGDLRYVGSALLPWWSLRDLRPEPAGLYEASWAPLHERGRVELLVDDLVHIDCGTAADYLSANMTASGGESVVGEGAVVEGELVRSVVWPGARVDRNERLVDTIRADGLTVRPAGA